MIRLLIFVFFILSFSSRVEGDVRQSIACLSFEEYVQQYKSPHKSYEKAFLKSLTYPYWFVPPPPDVDQSRLEPMMNTPQVALKTNKGWLAGISRGEFGGAVTLHRQNGRFEMVTEAIVEDIFEMPFGIVVTEGLAHLGSNNGSILLLKSTKQGFSAQKIHGLPGMPKTSWKLPNGDLLINTHKMGSVVLNKAGALQLVKCHQV